MRNIQDKIHPRHMKYRAIFSANVLEEELGYSKLICNHKVYDHELSGDFHNDHF